jgi:hypothetical protein
LRKVPVVVDRRSHARSLRPRSPWRQTRPRARSAAAA